MGEKNQLSKEDRREKCAPVPPETQPKTVLQIMSSLSTTNPLPTHHCDILSAIAAVQIGGEKWNGIREWKKAIPASISLSPLKKMSNHGSEKQNL